jgi:hypothetical protein
MLELINLLCKNKNYNENLIFKLVDSFYNSRAISYFNKDKILNDLVLYRHEKTGDNILLYAARCGNLELIKELKKLKSDLINFNLSNNDGKNALHEVK